MDGHQDFRLARKTSPPGWANSNPPRVSPHPPAGGAGYRSMGLASICQSSICREHEGARMSESNKAADLGPLPQWDLNDLYPGRESTALKQALADAESEATTFRAH